MSDTCNNCKHSCFTHTKEEIDRVVKRVAAQYEPMEVKRWFGKGTRTVYSWPDEYESRADAAYIDSVSSGVCKRYPKHGVVTHDHTCGEWSRLYECSSMCCPDGCKEVSKTKPTDELVQSPNPGGQISMCEGPSGRFPIPQNLDQ